MADLKRPSPLILSPATTHPTLPEAGLAGSLEVHSQEEGPALLPHPLSQAGGVAVVQAGCPDQRVVHAVHAAHPAGRGRRGGWGSD